MKRLFLFAALLCAITPVIRAQERAKKAKEEIHWITSFDELQQKMSQNPKKVYVDIYTDWCGWCKKMEATTFQNPDLIKYINANFYAFRFNAERQDVIHFNGKEYQYEPQYRANALAIELVGGPTKLGFPTSVFMMENFQNPTPVGNYLTVPQIEPILTYFGDNACKHEPWPTYQQSYKPVWDHGIAADNTPPPGH